MKITQEQIGRLTRNVVAAMTMTETKDSSSTLNIAQVYDDVVLTVRGISKHKDYYTSYALWGFRDPDNPVILTYGDCDTNAINKRRNQSKREHELHLGDALAAWSNHEV